MAPPDSMFSALTETQRDGTPGRDPDEDEARQWRLHLIRIGKGPFVSFKPVGQGGGRIA